MPSIVLFWCLRSLFRLYGRGQVFTARNAGLIKAVGVWLVLGQLYVRDGRFGRGAYKPDKNDFAPRVGIAWTVTPETVIRSGAGSPWSGCNPGWISRTSRRN